MAKQRNVVIGGGAAGFFGAIACAEMDPSADVLLLEKSPEWLAKVTLSGGGRCNVTHHCFDVARLVQHYPRGRRELQGPFHRFQPRDTVEWFETRGVPLKVETDGRMFPVTDRSSSIVQCLMEAAQRAGVRTQASCGVAALAARPEGGFELQLTKGEALRCDRVLLATGGNRNTSGYALAASVGHTIEPPVPSLFTFHTGDARWHALSGLSVPDAVASAPAFQLQQRGPLLITHWGLSGPAILKLSAWGARTFAACAYAFDLQVNWVPSLKRTELLEQLRHHRAEYDRQQVDAHPLFNLPQRLWTMLTGETGVRRWAQVSNVALEKLAQELQATPFTVQDKSMNKDEFVTCGGVRLSEVNFKTMESKLCPGLHFAGEVLDIDAVTGGFNFQAAWTTGWLAGQAMTG
jgi:predicted Rossmann fold flavoprotein